MVTWGEFEAGAPELAEFGASLLLGSPAFFATTRSNGIPRVHPVTPIIGDGHLFLFMEPNSPKARDLDEQHSYAMHNGVPDSSGTGGEFWITGRGARVDDVEVREVAAIASKYSPADRYILFELEVSEARCNGYGDVELPEPRRWRAPSDID
jgi:hypothetical protein